MRVPLSFFFLKGPSSVVFVAFSKSFSKRFLLFQGFTETLLPSTPHYSPLYLMHFKKMLHVVSKTARASVKTAERVAGSYRCNLLLCQI